MDAVTEIVPNTFPDLFWGYSVMWLCILFYLISLIRRVRVIESRVAEHQSKKSTPS
jgi:CcmD family protein